MKVVLDYLSGSPLTNDPIDIDHLYQTVVDRRFAILIASACVWTVVAIGIYLTASPWPLVWALAETGLTVWRWTMLSRADRVSWKTRNRDRRRLSALTMAWSAVFGLGVFWCLLSGNVDLTIIACVLTATVVGVFSFRNAATPRIAYIAIALVGLPFLAGMGMSPLNLTWAASAISAPWLLGLALMTMQSHRFLLRLIVAERSANRLALTDPLTGLRNRMSFGQHAETLKSGGRDDEEFAYLCLDLDGFKQVNDMHGHSAGDHVLQETAQRMIVAVRQDDVVFRLGGDEFVIYLPKANADDCTKIAKRLIEVLGEPFELPNGQQVSIGASAGSACAGETARGTEELLNAADAALYRAKTLGRNRHVPALHR